MKVLLCGGIKTGNIADALRSLRKEGIDFIVLKYLEEIEDLFTRGEYFDRAIIIEQSWNKDNTETDEYKIRYTLNSFASSQSSKKTRDIDYIFLTQSEKSAEIVFEETLPLRQHSIVIVKESPYTAGFFKSLVLNKFDEFPDDIVYNPLKVDKEHEAENLALDNKGGEEDETSDDTKGSLDELGDFEDNTNEDLGYFDGFDDIDVEVDEGIDDSFGDISDIGGIEIEGDNQEGLFNISEKDNINKDDEIDIEDFDDAFESLDEDKREQEKERRSTSSIFGNIHSSKIIENNKITDNLFSDDVYSKGDVEEREEGGDIEVEDEGKSVGAVDNKQLTDEQVRAILDVFANRGNAIAVTGCSGSGVSTVAYHLANIIFRLGYTVLLVDMDTEGKSQAYISKDNYKAVDQHSSNLMAALKSSYGVDAYISVVQPGFRLITMGMGAEPVNLEKMIEVNKLQRFMNTVRTSHNFVVYDLPFRYAVGCASEIVFTVDNLVMVVDSSNWGITKAMLNICNIDSDDVMDVIFNKAQIVFNRFKGINRFAGRRVRNLRGVLRLMDVMVEELEGTPVGYKFESLPISGVVPYKDEFELGWYGTKQYSNTPEGSKIFIDLLKNITTKTNIA
jgi:cellulose biosynthesis protein BcsQ